MVTMYEVGLVTMCLIAVSTRASLLYRRKLPREEGSVYDVNVFGAVDLSVGINNASSAGQTAIGSDLRCADPVVRTALAGSEGKLETVLVI